MNFILFVFALFYPNEFYVHTVRPSYDIPFNESLGRVIKHSSGDLNRNTPIVSVSIKDYKVKSEGGKTMVIYKMVVKVDQNSHIVKRTYYEFRSLHMALKRLYSS